MKLIKNYTPKFLQENKYSKLGIDLEFSITTLNGKITDLNVIKKLIFFIQDTLGLVGIATDNEHNPIKFRYPATGDVVSFQYREKFFKSF